MTEGHVTRPKMLQIFFTSDEKMYRASSMYVLKAKSRFSLEWRRRGWYGIKQATVRG